MLPRFKSLKELFKQENKELLDEEQLKQIYENKLVFTRRFVYFVSTTNFFSQVIALGDNRHDYLKVL
jgi:hypothetical protein